ncbi:peptidoglycan binding protein CsiV [Shewanella jiangmenensis]|nr:peptidoglycan binding protein CsiV [Shewanella jiangmenensis]
MRKIALAASFCLLPLGQAMAESWFEVEVFLFERNQPSAETWPKTPKIPPYAKGRDLIGERFQSAPDAALTPCSEDERVVDPLRCDGIDMQRSSFASSLPSPMPTKVTGKSAATAQSGAGAQLLDSSQLQLGDLVSNISRERGIKPLMHIGWQQPMEARHASKPIRLFGGENFADRFVLGGALKETPAIASGAGAGFGAGEGAVSDISASTAVESAAPTTPVWQLEGLLNVYLSQYLYVETDLVLRAPGTRKVVIEPATVASADVAAAAVATAETGSGQTAEVVSPLPVVAASSDAATLVMPNVEEQPFLYAVPLNQNRRVRSGQVHYFDHPKLGLIIQVRKMAQPSGAVDIEEPAAEPEGDDTPAADVINGQQPAQD